MGWLTAPNKLAWICLSILNSRTGLTEKSYLACQCCVGSGHLESSAEQLWGTWSSAGKMGTITVMNWAKPSSSQHLPFIIPPHSSRCNMSTFVVISQILRISKCSNTFCPFLCL
jgi:hypothetical protein